LSKIPFTFFLLGYLATVGWDYYGFKSDADSPLQQKRAEIEAAREEVTKLRKKFVEVETFRRNLEIKRGEIQKLTEELNNTKSSLSDDFDIPFLMKTILTEANRVGLVVKSLRPGAIKQAEYYSEQPFDLEFRGVYFQLVGFMSRIANLQKIIRTDEIGIKRVSSPDSRYVELSGKLQLKTYRYKHSKADEISRGHEGKASLASGGGGAQAAPVSPAPMTPPAQVAPPAQVVPVSGSAPGVPGGGK
jgi:Tfp pilus assembly protein PilO